MVKHPAKYNDALMPIFANMLKGSKMVLDPFAGTGKVFDLQFEYPWATYFGLEIEPEWASMRRNSNMTIGNALYLPFADNTFDAIVTSPCYGNRMADHHNARDGSPRNTYTHVLGRKLHPDNSGQLQWGDRYREFHTSAWTECFRVLKPRGKFILNIKDHIRDGVIQQVARWHHTLIELIGFETIDVRFVSTPGNRMGQNGNARVDYEEVILFRKVDNEK